MRKYYPLSIAESGLSEAPYRIIARRTTFCKGWVDLVLGAREMDVDQISDHLEIQQVLYRYCRGIDRGDVELLKSVYHHDARDAHGAFNGLAHEFAYDIVARMDAVDLVGQHSISNILIELDGDCAQVESYFQAFHPDAGGNGVVGHAFVCGRYLDRFERRSGCWKIADRRVVFDLSREPKMPPAWASSANYPKGQRRNSDPSDGMFRQIPTA